MGPSRDAAAIALLNNYLLPNMSAVYIQSGYYFTRYLNVFSISIFFVLFLSYVFIGGITLKTCQHSCSKDGGIERGDGRPVPR